MVFRFGEVELTPTIEEILNSYESVAMCSKRKRHPDTDLLNPITWDFAKINGQAHWPEYTIQKFLLSIWACKGL